MRRAEDNVMRDDLEKPEILNIIFARHLKDPNVIVTVSIDLPKANSVLMQPGCLS